MHGMLEVEVWVWKDGGRNEVRVYGGCACEKRRRCKVSYLRKSLVGSNYRYRKN